MDYFKNCAWGCKDLPLDLMPSYFRRSCEKVSAAGYFMINFCILKWMHCFMDIMA